MRCVQARRVTGKKPLSVFDSGFLFFKGVSLRLA
jgi:hypothetical protein